jgi:hypothetical protein
MIQVQAHADEVLRAVHQEALLTHLRDIWSRWAIPEPIAWCRTCSQRSAYWATCPSGSQWPRMRLRAGTATTR